MKGKHMFVTDATIHRNGKSQLLLGNKTVDLKHWPRTDHPNYRNDVALVAVGSLGKLLEHTNELVVVQGITPNGVGVISGAFSTPQDAEGLGQIVRWREEDIQTGKGWLVRRHIIHPNSPSVVAHVLARGAYQGNGSDPKLALERLQTDTLLRADLDAFTNGIVGRLSMHRVAGFTGVYFRGFGGTYPWMDYAHEVLTSSMKQNMEIDVRVIPTREEFLSRKNAKGVLYSLIASGVGSDRLVVVKEQQHRGAHQDDPAFVMGLVAVTGSSYATQNPDAASIFRLMYESGNGWVEARPTIVDVPLAHLESRVLVLKKHHQIRPPEGESPGLRILLRKVHSLLALDKDAFHLMVVAGSFQEHEDGLIRKAVVSMAPPGHVVPVIANLWPKISEGVAKYLLCDLVSAPELPRTVTSVFLDQELVMSRPGMTPEEFLRKVPEPSEFKDAKEVEERIGWLCPAGS